MRYIDVIRTILRNASEKDIPALTWDEQRTHLNKIRKRIDDVEIVVRCKDCKHYSVEGDVTIFGYCNGVHEHDTDPNGYCHHGERRK